MKNYLGIILAKENECEGMELFFPTQTKVVKRILETVGAGMNNWHISAVCANSNNLCAAIFGCKNLSELNYLGYLMDKMDDDMSASFLDACELPQFACESIETFINVAIGILRGYGKFYKHYNGKVNNIPEKHRIFA